MVNYGVSKACIACKKQRKKCDEARPKCSRCVKSRNTCVYEYEIGDEVVFKHFTPQRLASQTVPPKQNRERNAGSTHTISIRPSHHGHIIDPTSHHADLLDTFLHDFSYRPANPQLSRGYLSGLPLLLSHSPTNSDVHNAALVAALGHAGVLLHRTDLLEEAEVKYVALLRSFRSLIASLRSSSAPHHHATTFATSVLLGLYEMITATSESPGAQNHHLAGLGAILKTAGPPFDALGGLQFFAMANAPPVLVTSLSEAKVDADYGDKSVGLVFSNPPMQDLSVNIFKLSPVFERADEVLAADFENLAVLNEYLEEAVAVERNFAMWAEAQRGEWRPKSLEYAMPAICCNGKLKLWSGRTEVFYDIYVASVWNTYRKCHILILSYLLRATEKLEAMFAGSSKTSSEQQEAWKGKAERLAEDIFASVAFCLTELSELKTSAGTSEVEESLDRIGRAVNGLVSIHPLYVVAKTTIVGKERNEYAASIMRWIRKEMGIGEGAVLADAGSTIPLAYHAKGHILIWAGMLIQAQCCKV